MTRDTTEQSGAAHSRRPRRRRAAVLGLTVLPYLVLCGRRLRLALFR